MKKERQTKKQSDATKLVTVFCEFEITIPEDYTHSKQLARFKRKNKGNWVQDSLYEREYKKTSHKLEKGKTYLVRFFLITAPEIISASEGLSFLEKSESLLVGPQGISIIWELKKDVFPKNKTVYVLEKPENCPADKSFKNRICYIPIFCDHDGDIEFRNALFSHLFTDNFLVGVFKR